MTYGDHNDWARAQGYGVGPMGDIPPWHEPVSYTAKSKVGGHGYSDALLTMGVVLCALGCLGILALERTPTIGLLGAIMILLGGQSFIAYCVVKFLR